MSGSGMARAPPAFVGVTCGTAAGGGMYASGTAPGAMRIGTSGPTVVGSGGTWTGGGARGRARTPQTVVVVVVAIAVWGRSLKATAGGAGGRAHTLFGLGCFFGPPGPARNVGTALVVPFVAMQVSRLLLSKQKALIYCQRHLWIHLVCAHRKLLTVRLGDPHEAYGRFELGSPAAGYRGRGAASNAGPRDPQAAEEWQGVL